MIANSTVDTDTDGSSNHLDVDADNDGFFDLVEAGGDDVNSDGIVDGWIDSDGDGIADIVDVDSTGGEDADGDGIDDFADADFVGLADSDGDGIVDLFDTDTQGTGYLPILTFGAPIDLTVLPDSDGNGVSDVVDFNEGSTEIRTGLHGYGCAINGSGGSNDPMLALLGLLAAGGVAMRRRRAIRTGNRAS